TVLRCPKVTLLARIDAAVAAQRAAGDHVPVPVHDPDTGRCVGRAVVHTIGNDVVVGIAELVPPTAGRAGLVGDYGGVTGWATTRRLRRPREHDCAARQSPANDSVAEAAAAGAAALDLHLD